MELKAQHIGLYWSQVYDRYPKCEQQVAIAGIAEALDEIFPLPRFWFSKDGEPTLLQCQRDAFLFNWRRQRPSDEYPHYDAVKKCFFEELDSYQAFLAARVGRQIDVVRNCELTYVNIIHRNDFWSTHSQIGEVLPALDRIASVQDEEWLFTGTHVVLQYRAAENIAVNADIKTAKLKSGEALVFLLELKARGAPPRLSIHETQGWYEGAHDAIQNLFLRLTRQELQKLVWQPK